MSLSRRGFIERAAAAGALSGTWAGAQSVPRSGGPNILYIIQEDIGPNHACYGEPLVKTPHVDRLSETRQPCGSGVPDAGICADEDGVDELVLRQNRAATTDLREANRAKAGVSLTTVPRR